MRFVVRCSSNHIFSYRHRQIHKGRDTQKKNKYKNKQKTDRLMYKTVSPKNIIRIEFSGMINKPVKKL